MQRFVACWRDVLTGPGHGGKDRGGPCAVDEAWEPGRHMWRFDFGFDRSPNDRVSLYTRDAAAGRPTGPSIGMGGLEGQQRDGIGASHGLAPERRRGVLVCLDAVRALERARRHPCAAQGLSARGVRRRQIGSNAPRTRMREGRSRPAHSDEQQRERADRPTRMHLTNQLLTDIGPTRRTPHGSRRTGSHQTPTGRSARRPALTPIGRLGPLRPRPTQLQLHLQRRQQQAWRCLAS